MSYTYEQLESYTLIELREMCRDEGISGMSKQRKDDVIKALMDVQGEIEVEENELPEPGPVVGGAKGVSGTFFTTLTDPKAPEGQRTTTTVRVSCGASSDFFNVAGKSVAAVAGLLKDAFSISDLTTGVVNGKRGNGGDI